MRGDLTIHKNANVSGLVSASKFVVNGNIITQANEGVGKRETKNSFRVSLSAKTICDITPNAAAGVVVPVRFVITLDRTPEGGRVYRIVAANGRPAHGVIRTRN